jgi:hypothetical protein
VYVLRPTPHSRSLSHKFTLDYFSSLSLLLSNFLLPYTSIYLHPPISPSRARELALTPFFCRCFLISHYTHIYIVEPRKDDGRVGAILREMLALVQGWFSVFKAF